MKIVIAPDSFKGSLTAIEAADRMKQAAKEIIPTAEVQCIPMADGGEGTLDALLMATGGERININCTGPLGKEISTSYGIIDKKTAIIECAAIAGLTQVPMEKRTLDETTSFGMGEVISDALNKGCTSFIIGLGGSATNDGGLGMLQALGMTAWDDKGEEIGPFGKDLLQVAHVSFEKIDKRLASVEINVPCDVNNPLCGSHGATAVYGPQKGATKEQVKTYDQALDHYSDLVESILRTKNKNVAGAGAAGGLGFAFLTIGAELSSGAKIVADATHLEHAIQRADLVLTGEGQSDEQTLYGKAPGYVAELANRYDIPAVLISGSLTGKTDVLREMFAGSFSIISKPLSLGEAMEQASRLLYEKTKHVVHFIDSIQ